MSKEDSHSSGGQTSTGSKLRDAKSRDSTSQDSKSRDPNSRDPNSHDSKSRDPNSHDSKSRDTNSYESKSRDTNTSPSTKSCVSLKSQAVSVGVLVTCCVIVSLSGGTTTATSVLIVEFLQYFRESNFKTSWCSSIYMMAIRGTGPLCMVLLTRVTHRQLVVFGFISTCAGFVMSSFATNVYHLYVTFGIITGLGMGMLNYIASIYASEYFIRWRYLAMGLVQSGGSIGSMYVPPMMYSLIEAYTWRGAMMVFGAFVFQLLVLSVFFPPIEHLTEFEKHSNKRGSTNKAFENEIDGRYVCQNGVGCHTGATNIDTQTVKTNRDTGDSKVIETRTEKTNGQIGYSGKADAIFTVENTDKSDIEIQVEHYTRPKNITESLRDIFREWRFYAFAYSVVMNGFALGIVLTFNMDYFLSVGVPKPDAVTIVSLVGVGNIVSRLSASVAAHCVNSRRGILLVLAAVMFAVSAVVMSQYTDYTVLVVVELVIGAAYGFVAVGVTVVPLELFGLERLRAAFALVLVIYGVGLLTGPVIAGQLLDMTQHYTHVYLLCMAAAISGALAILPVLIIQKGSTHGSPHQKTFTQNEISLTINVEPPNDKL